MATDQQDDPKPKRPRGTSRRRDFGVVIPDGTTTNPSFSIRWWEGGKWRRKRGLRTKTEAAAELARIRTLLSDGVLDAHRRSDVTLSVVAAEWLRNHSAVKLRSHADNEERWQGLEDFFGKTTALRQVTPSRILEARQQLTTGHKPATVNRYLALLRTVLNYAVTAGYLQASPVRRFPRGSYMLPEPRPKRAPPLASNQEAARLILALRHGVPEWWTLFAFLLLTGARRGEAAGLRWADVDLARRLVTIRRSYEAPPKSGRERTVPLSAQLVKILAEHRARDPWGGALVFPDPATGKMLAPNLKLRALLDTACDAAGVPRMRVHDLRHAQASLWLMAGGSLMDVQRNLGHSTPVITSEMYAHIADDHRIAEADARLTIDLDAADAVSKLGVVKGGR